MMDPRPLDRDLFDRLARHRAEPSYSIYLPTEPKGPEVEKAAIRLKNARSELSERLVEAGIPASRREALLAPLVEAEDDHRFWQHQSRGLALLGSEEHVEPIRLPYRAEPSLHLTDRFHLRPLLGALSRVDTPVLALSTEEVRLLELSDGNISEVEYQGPRSITDTNWFLDKESRLQTHATGVRNAGFHGHDPDDRSAEDRNRFLREVGAAVAETVPDGERVLVAAVDELLAAYREVAPHPVHRHSVSGSPDGMSGPQLLERLEPALEAIASQRVAGISAALDDARSAGRYEEDPAAIARAAGEGRVEALVLGADAPAIPAADDTAGITEARSDGPLDLLDEAVRHAWSNGGAVHLVSDVPGTNSTVAAALRF